MTNQPSPNKFTLKNFLGRNALLTGTLLLTAAGVLTRVIGFFYKIFLSRTIGAEGLGIYQLLTPVLALAFAVTSAGIQTSISKYVSMEIGRHRPVDARNYLLAGLSVSLFLSALLGLFVWKQADFIAVAWLGDARCAPLLSVLALSFLPSSIHSCINGYYYGLKKTAVPSLTQLFEQIARVFCVYVIYQIYQSRQMPLPFTAMVWGIVAGECASMLICLSVIQLPKNNRTSSGQPARSAYIFGNGAPALRRYYRDLMQMALPLTFNRVILNLFSSVENIMIPNRLRMFGYSNAEALGVYGILTGMSMSVIMLPSVLVNSVSVLLLPTISESQATGNTAHIRKTVQRTIFSCLLFGFFCSVVFLFTGKWIGNLLFSNSLSGTFIITLGWICPFLYLSATLNSILHGLGHPGVTFMLSLIACGIRIVFVLFALPVYGIRSYLIGLLASQIITSLLTVVILYRMLGKEK